MDISADRLMAGFEELRREGLLCDITLQTEGRSITAHRTVLAAASLYFRAMFGGNFKEAKKDVVDLDKLGISYEGLSSVIESLYSLKLNITQDNFIDVTMAACVLQFTEIMPFCNKFVRNNVTVDNCFKLLLMCETYNMEEQSLRKVHAFIQKNFIPVMKQNHPEFLEISKNCLVHIISDMKLCTAGDETEVYQAVIKWVNTSDSRKDFICELMKHIRIHLIPEEIITDDLAKEPLLINNEECVQLLQKAKDYHAFPFKQPLMETLPIRGELAVVMFIDTAESSGSNQNRWSLKPPPFNYFECHEKTMCPISIDHDTTCSYSSIHKVGFKTGKIWGLPLNSFIYFLYRGHDLETPPNTSLHRYDPACNKWLCLSPLVDPQDKGFRCAYYSVVSVLENSLLVGMRGFGFSEPFPAFLYDVQNNTWNGTTDMPQDMDPVLSCSHNNGIYITSYIESWDDQENCHEIEKMWMFSGEDTLWHEKAPPLCTHDDGFFAAVNNKLYIAGGRSNVGDRYQLSAEMYEVATDQWSYVLDSSPFVNIDLLCNIESVQTYVDGTRIYCFGKKHIYVFDGFTEEESDIDGIYGHRYLDVALVWDTCTGEVCQDSRWEKVKGMQEVAVVTVPVGRFDF